MQITSNSISIFSYTSIKSINKIYCGNSQFEANTFEEKLPNGAKYNAVYNKKGSFHSYDKFMVPKNHYFFFTKVVNLFFYTN